MVIFVRLNQEVLVDLVVEVVVDLIQVVELLQVEPVIPLQLVLLKDFQEVVVIIYVFNHVTVHINNP